MITRKHVGVAIALVLTIFFFYHEALNNELLNWDTKAYIIDNPQIQSLTWEHLKWMFTAFYVANWHPLTWLSHAIDYALYGLNPWGHHLTSLIFHSLNTLLVFTLALVILKFPPNQTLVAAGLAALLFGIHPQHVESVVWVAERKDVLCLFFTLLTLLTYCTIRRHTLLFFTLALLTKPMAVTIPFLLLLLDVYPLQRTSLTTPNQAEPYRKLLLEKIPFLLLAVISSVITLFAQAAAIASANEVNFSLRLLNAANSLIFYLSKFIFPVLLSPFYPFPSQLSWYPVLAGLLITFVSGYLWTKNQPYWLISWLFYIISLLPVIGLIQVGSQAAADRYAYLPTLPFYLLIGVYASHRLVRVSLLMVISVLLGYMTYQQIFIWRNDVTLWQQVVLYYPDSPETHHRLGNAYQRVGDYEKAIAHYLLIQNMNVRGNSQQLALTYLKMHKLPEALKIYQTMLKQPINLGEELDEVYYNIGWIYYQQHRLAEARQFIAKALRVNPHHSLAQQLQDKLDHDPLSSL